MSTIPDDVIEAMGQALREECRNTGVTSDSHEAMRAALAEAEANGWRMVPVDASDEMLGSFVRQLADRKKMAAVLSLLPDDVRAAYLAMLDAAPKVKP